NAEKSVFDAHLAVCAQCAESKKQIEALDLRLREEPSFQPPAHAVRAWINLFPAASEPEKSSLRQIIASLVYDSFDQPMLAGMRSLGAAPRQFQFRADDVDVDVKIESTERNEWITLSGQVISGASKFPDNVPVELQSQGGVRYQTRTNELGEFSFEAPK